MAPADAQFSRTESTAGASFVMSVCLPLLKSAQNEDGGWGFRAGSESRVEPTSWALLGLSELEVPTETLAAGFRFLRSTQLPNGSWPASPGQTVGCWAASLACWALAHDLESQTALTTGLRWICADWPKDLTFVQRTMRKIRSLAKREVVSQQDESLRGWGWTPNTASWVEPTAFGLLSVDQAPKHLLPASAGERQRLAKSMLHNRMCPGGGWNCGNPVVYGVAGNPSIPQTVWALLALRNDPSGEVQTSSLQWLEKSVKGAIGIGSLALAKICLETYGREFVNAESRFRELYERNGFLGNVPAIAWTCLALGGRSERWLKREKA